MYLNKSIKSRNTKIKILVFKKLTKRENIITIDNGTSTNKQYIYIMILLILHNVI